MTKQSQDFQGALKKLELLVEELGSGDIDIDAGLTKFKEGVVLIKQVREQLKKDENEFKKVKEELEEESGNEQY